VCVAVCVAVCCCQVWCVAERRNVLQSVLRCVAVSCSVSSELLCVCVAVYSNICVAVYSNICVACVFVPDAEWARAGNTIFGHTKSISTTLHMF